MSHNTQSNRPLILICNDDGIEAAGVHALIDYITDLADIVCVCPDSPRSGQSMALTVNAPLRIKEHEPYMGARMYSTNGTPVDCVKLAMHTLLDRRPDLVVSGINHGSNAAINVVYSGTMGAAFEGCAFGLSAVGFSLTDHNPQADFKPSRPFVRTIVRTLLQHQLPKGVCLNVNIPASVTQPTSMKMARACRGNWSDEYEEHIDPEGKPYYMLSGRFDNLEPGATDTDEYQLAHGIVSIVPVSLDRTVSAQGIPHLPETPDQL